jgi:PPOX class probable F420-dependent enzyme
MRRLDPPVSRIPATTQRRYLPRVTEAEMRERFERARIARLATVDVDGQPHVVPICFALIGDRIVSVVDAKPKRTPKLRRLANIRVQPRVSVLVDEYDEDWTRLWWVRADGAARVVEDGNERDDAVATLTAKYPQYEEEPPAGPMVEISVDRWRSWSAS